MVSIIDRNSSLTIHILRFMSKKIKCLTNKENIRTKEARESIDNLCRWHDATWEDVLFNNNNNNICNCTDLGCLNELPNVAAGMR